MGYEINLSLIISGLGWAGFSLYFPKISGIFLAGFSGSIYTLCLVTYLYQKNQPPKHSPPPGFIDPILMLYVFILINSAFLTIPMSIIWGIIFGLKYLSLL